jgi:DNA-binding MarR family transcriptional regulator
MNGAQRRAYAKQLKDKGFIDDASWQTALGKADETKTAYLAAAKGGRRKTISTAASKAAISEILSDLPNQSYIAPETGSIFDELGEDVGLTRKRVTQVVAQLCNMGVVDKMFDEKGSRIVTLKLVS